MAATLTVREIVTLSAGFLKTRGSDTPRLDAEILAAHVLKLRRLDLYLSPERPLVTAEVDALRDLVRRRGKGEPVAYLTGCREFFGLRLEVTPAVLIPRPETETLVDAVLEHLKRPGAPAEPEVLDVGTGSGAIACAVAANHAAARVVALDVSPGALAVAARNVAALGLADRVRTVESDLLRGLDAAATFDVVVSNPPYVADGEPVDASARDFEPRGALYSGPDGMDVTMRLADEALPRLRPGGALAVEVGSPAQRDRVQALLAARVGADRVRPLPDPAGVVRGFLATRD